jgi:hypothetical protein
MPKRGGEIKAKVVNFNLKSPRGDKKRRGGRPYPS